MHPTPETLNRFLADDLNEAEANSIAEHLSECRHCQDWLEGRALKLQREIELSQPAMETAHVRIASRIAMSIEASTRDDNTVASVPLNFVRKINSGGMGDVYEYRDKSLDRPVAVKYMRAELRESPELSRRFEREIRIASKLGYRGTPTVLGTSNASDGSLFYWMAFTEGQSLSELIKDTDSPARFSDRSDEEIRKKLNWVVEIARIVHRAHLRKILHRDLKPSNVLLDRDGLPVVIDWGLAKELDAPKASDENSQEIPASPESDGLIASQAFTDTDIDQLTQSDDVVGTPAYIAPEMRRPQAGGDARTDVYGLGGILFEMLVGYPPNYDPATNKPKYEKLGISSFPRNALAGVPSVPPELASICNRALAISPDDRYQTAEEFASDLERFVSSQPVLAHSYTPWQKTTRLFSKYSERIIVAVVGLAIVAIAIAIAAVAIDGARRTTQKALDSEQRTLDEATDFSESAIELSSSLQAKLGDTKQFKQFLDQQTQFLNGLDERAPENPRIAEIHARLFNQEFQSKVNSGRSAPDTEARLRKVIDRLQSLSGKSVELNFQLALAYKNLAVVLMSANQIEQACEAAEKAVEFSTAYRNPGGQIDQLLLLQTLIKKQDCLLARTETLRRQENAATMISVIEVQIKNVEVQVVETLEKLPEQDLNTTRRYSLQLARQRVIEYESASLEKKLAACQAGLAEATQFASENVADRHDWMIFIAFQADLIRVSKGNGVAEVYEKDLISTLALLNQCIEFALKLEKGDPIYSEIGDRGLYSAYKKMYLQIELYMQGSDRFAVNEFEQTAREIIELGQRVIDEGILVERSKRRIVDWPLTLIDGLMSAKQVEQAIRILDLIEGLEKDERQQIRFANLKAKIASQK